MKLEKIKLLLFPALSSSLPQIVPKDANLAKRCYCYFPFCDFTKRTCIITRAAQYEDL